MNSQKPLADDFQVRRFCVCSHSSAAHDHGGEGRCGFCHCQAFRLGGVERRLEGALVEVERPASWKRMSLLQAASQLGLGARDVYELLASGDLRGEKRGGRWFVSAGDVNQLEQQLSAVLKRRPSRSQVAQSAGLHSFLGRMEHHGMSASAPVRPHLASEERRSALQEVLNEQLSTALLSASPDPRSRTRRRSRAQSAQSGAFDDWLLRPARAAPKQRSM